MTDRQLTTRDLAETSDTDAGAQANSEQQVLGRNTLADSTSNREPLGETTATDEPLARDRSENEQEDTEVPKEPAEALSADLPSTRRARLEPTRAPSSNMGRGSLLPDDQSERFTTRWQQIQASFVDQPRDSVEQADALVADLMQRLAASFSYERERLEDQWERGDDISTEDLRVALTRYRSFFERLLSA